MKQKWLLPLLAGVLVLVGTSQVSAATTTITGAKYADIVTGDDGYSIMVDSNGTTIDLIDCDSVDCNAPTKHTLLTGNGTAKIALDSAKIPRVIIYNSTTKDILQVRCGDTECTTFSTDTITNLPSYSIKGMGIDTNGFMAFLVGPNGSSTQRDLDYYHCTDLTCSAFNQKVIVQSPTGSANYSSSFHSADLAFDSQGKPHIAYAPQYDTHSLNLVQCDDADCSTFTTQLVKDETVASHDEYKDTLDLSFTRDDLPRIAFQEYLSCDVDGFYCGVPHVKLAVCDDTQCTTNKIVNVGNDWASGYVLRMAMNSQDYPVLVYDYTWRAAVSSTDTSSITSAGLVKTECQDKTCTSMEKNELISAKDLAAAKVKGVYDIANIALDRNDNVVIPVQYAYGSNTASTRLDYITSGREGETWPKYEKLFSQVSYRLSKNQNIGRIADHTQVELGPDNLPRLMYYDYWMDAVNYVRCFNEECTDNKRVIVDGEGDSVNYAPPIFGGYIDMKIGSDGLARLLYTAGGDSRTLKLAICNDQDCSSPNIVILGTDTSASHVYPFRSATLALSPTNVPYIIYTRVNEPIAPPYQQMDEYIGICDDAVCSNFTSTQILAGDALWGFVGSAFSPAGDFMFTHYDPTNGGELWRCTVADCSNIVKTNIHAPFTSPYHTRYYTLKFGSDNLPRIAYMDRDSFLGYFIKCNDLDCTTSTKNVLPFLHDIDVLKMELNDSDLPRFVSATYPDPDYYGSLDYVYCADTACSSSTLTRMKIGTATPAIEYSYWVDMVLLPGDKPFIFNADPEEWTDSFTAVVFPQAVTCYDYTCAPRSGPSAPTSPYADSLSAQLGRVNPNDITNLDMYVSAIFQDQNVGDTASAYRLQVSTDKSFGTIIYDSGKTALTNPTAINSRSEDLNIPQSNLDYNHTYYWRVKYWDQRDIQGLYTDIFPTANTFFAPTPPLPSLANFAPASTVTTTGTPVTFDLTRATYGVDENNTKISVDGSVVWDSGFCTVGYTCTFSGITNGKGVSIASVNGWSNATHNVVVEYRISSTASYQSVSTQQFTVSISTAATVLIGSGGGGGGAYRNSTTVTVGDPHALDAQRGINQDSHNAANTQDLETIYPSDNGSDSMSLAEKLYDNALKVVERTPVEPSLHNAAEGSLVGQSLCTDLERQLSDYFATTNESDFRKLIREHGLVLGNTDKNFDPSSYITRSEMLRLVLQADCGSYRIPDVKVSPFPDVPTTHKDALYIAISRAQDIVSGYLSDGTYKPDNNISRAEALKVVLEVVLGRKGYTLQGDGSTDIADVSKDTWYYRYIDYAASRGIISKDNFRPGDQATIDEVAGFLLRTLDFVGR